MSEQSAQRLEWTFVVAYVTLVAAAVVLIVRGLLDPHAFYVLVGILVPSPATPLFARLIGAKLFPAGATISIPPVASGHAVSEGQRIVVPPADRLPKE